jgi:hypothetical protein
VVETLLYHQRYKLSVDQEHRTPNGSALTGTRRNMPTSTEAALRKAFSIVMEVVILLFSTYIF